MNREEIKEIKDKVDKLEREIEELKATNDTQNGRLESIESELGEYKQILDAQTQKLTGVLRKQTLILTLVLSGLGVVGAIAPEQVPHIADLLATIFTSK